MFTCMKEARKKTHDERGTTMVEAAVIFPLVILASIAVVFILGYMYSQVHSNAKMHLALNDVMGSESETVFTKSKVPKGINTYESPSFSGKTWHASESIRFQKRGLLKAFSKESESRVYEVDEKKYIRYHDFFNEE